MSERDPSVILTPDQRLRVFISSTLQELAPERSAARDAIAGLQLTPVLFELGARPHPPQALYRAYLEQSQLLVGVYWQSYGWVAPDATISGIEDEYHLAAALPRLLYVKEPAPEREQRLSDFLERVTQERSLSFKRFETAAELGELLARDLALLLTERFQLRAEPAAEPTPAAPVLPAPRTSFVGRDLELAQIEKLLADGVRLLTLTGPGGIGKTRLALEAARRFAPKYADGASFVSLDGLEACELVPAAMTEALGVRDDSGDPMGSLVAHLRGRRLLLVLDNFEHVIAAAPHVTGLLEQAPEVAALVTSRELLHLSGERELQVAPLALEDEAVALFVERAADARPDFELGPDDEPIAAEICRRLDGVPLAIELAAPMMRLLTPSQLLDRLAGRMPLEGPRDAPARQRTLDAAIAWSYELLDADERRLFERLGAFPGSFDIQAVQDVTAGVGDREPLKLLGSLLDKSMIYRLAHLGETRFAMLRMIREYALERLTEAGDLQPALERLADYYLRLANQAEQGLRSASQRQWKGMLDLEADNFRAVLGWAAEHRRATDISVLMRGLWLWFWLHGNLDEAREWVGRGLACGNGIGARDRGWLLGLDGIFAVLEGEFAEAGKLVDAETLLTEASDRRGIATMRLAHSFGVAPLEGEQRAQAQLAKGLAAFEELDDLWGIGTSLCTMGWLRTVYDRYEDAGDLFERALAAVERTGDELGIALALANLAGARLAAGDVPAARMLIGRALEQRRSGGITFGGGHVLEILARIEHADGEHERAIALLAAAESLRQRLHTPFWAPARERHERLLAELRDAVGDAALEAAYQRGATLEVDDVQEAAIRLASGSWPGARVDARARPTHRAPRARPPARRPPAAPLPAPDRAPPPSA